MTLREKAICEVFTGVCFCVGDQRSAVYEYAAELIGRPILTHEFYTLAKKLKELARADFIAICQDEPTASNLDNLRAHGRNTYGHDSAFECSACGFSDWDTMTADGKYNYCPGCGAKVDEGAAP